LDSFNIFCRAWHRVTRLCSEIVLDIISNVRSQEAPGVPLERGSIRTDEKLLKIPSNVSSLDWFPDEKLWVGHQALLQEKVGKVWNCASSLTVSSLGVGSSFFKRVNNGCSFSPFAST
jgi:hypothetical protein